jgi:hypothetical protein
VIGRFADTLRIEADVAGIGGVGGFGAIPTGVVEDVAEAVGDGEIDAGFAAGRGERGLADGFAGFDPRGVGEGAGCVEIQDEVVALDEIAGAVADDETRATG